MYVFYNTVSSPLDRSKRFTLHVLADLFKPTPTRIYSSILAKLQLCTKIIHSHFHKVLSIARYLVKYSSGNRGIMERTKILKTSKRYQRGFKHWALSIASPAFYRAPLRMNWHLFTTRYKVGPSYIPYST